jgi:hypothetical protein
VSEYGPDKKARALHVFAEMDEGQLHVVNLTEEERQRVGWAIVNEVGVLRVQEKPLEVLVVERKGAEEVQP